MKRMIWILWVIGAIVVVAGTATLIGALLPVGHVATCRAEIDQPPEAIWSALTDINGFPSWRTDLKRVEIIDDDREHPVWKEEGEFGVMTFERLEADPPRRLVGKIVGKESGFGGGWTYEITPKGTGSIVTVTENGEVYNPIFRFMSRFIFGHTKTLKDYLAQLGAKFGQKVEPVIVQE